MDCNIEDKHYFSPLYAACVACSQNAARILLEHGAKIDKPLDHNPLIVICKYSMDHNAIETLRVFIEYGVDIKYEYFIGQTGELGVNLAFFCTYESYKKMQPNNDEQMDIRRMLFIKELLNGGIDVNQIFHDKTNLACRRNDMRTAGLLIQYSCDHKLKHEEGALPVNKIESTEIKKQFLEMIDIIKIR